MQGLPLSVFRRSRSRHFMDVNVISAQHLGTLHLPRNEDLFELISTLPSFVMEGLFNQKVRPENRATCPRAYHKPEQ